MNYLQKQFLDFINKYPKQAHIVAVILAFLVGTYKESASFQHGVDSALAYSHIPHIATVATIVSGLIMWYTQHEK